MTFIGEASSPLVYFAGGSSECAVSVTASHNPPPDNGMKICRAGALPIGSANGLIDVARLVEEDRFTPAPRRGIRSEASPRREFIDFSLQALHARRRFKVVVDGGNGMGGPDYQALMERRTNVEIVPLYLEPNDSFPNHEANPLHFETLRDLQRKVVETKADLGVGLDGDGDRCFFVDETGAILPADLVTALIAQDVLADTPGATILHDLRSSRIVRETIAAAGGRPVECRVGHAFIKQQLREHRGIFAGELSRQGNDLGTQYRSAIFWTTEAQRAVAERVKAEVDRSGKWKAPLVTEIRRAGPWSRAEEYHQDYLQKNPGGYTCHFLRD